MVCGVSNTSGGGRPRLCRCRANMAHTRESGRVFQAKVHLKKENELTTRSIDYKTNTSLIDYKIDLVLEVVAAGRQ